MWIGRLEPREIYLARGAKWSLPQNQKSRYLIVSRTGKGSDYLSRNVLFLHNSNRTDVSTRAYARQLRSVYCVARDEVSEDGALTNRA